MRLTDQAPCGAGSIGTGCPSGADNPEVPKKKWSPWSRSVTHAGLPEMETTASRWKACGAFIDAVDARNPLDS
jgi:hypothetical protein